VNKYQSLFEFIPVVPVLIICLVLPPGYKFRSAKKPINLLKIGCIWSVDLYGSEIWTLGKNEVRVQNTFEKWCWRRMLKIKWTDRKQ
jgi:hypothetical protein